MFETHFHPDELVPNNSALYDLASARQNLAAVLGACHEARTPVAFVPARRVPALLAA